jgi:hypothetical protein
LYLAFNPVKYASILIKWAIFAQKSTRVFVKALNPQNFRLQHFVIKQTPPKIKLQVGSLL